MKFIEDSVLLVNKKAELSRKFAEAREYYGAEKELMLSITYKDGELHYSFHPIDLIKGRVTKIERRESGNDWKEIKPKGLL